jgi:hypothetical protein
VSLELKQNPFVDLLRSYGPLPSSNAQFDEHVQQTAKRKNVDPITVEAPRVDDLIAALRASAPPSIVLTGTAGDGKTYTVRHALEALGADMSLWGSRKILDIDVPGGSTVRVIKDLAELTDEEKLGVYQAFAASLVGEATLPLVIAANDGQLVAFVRQFAAQHAEGAQIDEAIRDLLVTEAVEAPGLRLRLYNLSRQPHDKLFSEVVQAIADHPAWSHCLGCALLPAGSCAIRHNLEILSDTSNPSLRSRLAQLIRLAALNDTHLPVRQLLLLCSNVLLGDRDTAGLIRCGDAHHLAMNGGANARVNPYRNVLGLNFDDATRQQFRAFTVFDSVGLGRETNNHFDELLIEQEPADRYVEVVAADTHFGDVLLASLRKQYRSNPADMDMPALHDALADQRRRLFFVLRDGDANLDPWRLTIFSQGGEYLVFADRLAVGQDATRVKRRLITGLNRVFTGLMADDDDRLWLTGPAGYTQSRQGRVLDTMTPIRLGASPQERLSVDFDAGGANARPRLVLVDGSEVVNAVDLTPLQFEYLVRIRDGSLPSSFSRQCFEELRQFRLKSIAALTVRGLIPAAPTEVTLVRLPTTGRLSMAPLPLEGA